MRIIESRPAQGFRGRVGFLGFLRLILVLIMTTLTSPAAFAIERFATIPLAGVRGRIDHLAADPAGHRVIVAALGNNTVEILDTRNKERRTLSGLGEPQGVLYLIAPDRLFIANGAANRVDIVDLTSLAEERRITGMNDADNIRYDEATRTVWVGYGRGALRMLDAATGESVGEVMLPGHPESFQLEHDGKRAFVNVPTVNKVVVIDRFKRQVIGQWETARASANYPMALDERGHRLFVGTRSPPLLLVYDTEAGKVVARLPIGKDTDDVFMTRSTNACTLSAARATWTCFGRTTLTAMSRSNRSLRRRERAPGCLFRNSKGCTWRRPPSPIRPLEYWSIRFVDPPIGPVRTI